MRNLIVVFSILLSVNLYSQKNYAEYYKALIGINLLNDTSMSAVKYESTILKRYTKAFKLNKPLPYHLLAASFYNYKISNSTKGQKYLMLAASSGINYKDTYFCEFFDSIFALNKKLIVRYNKLYLSALKKCDIENSLKIIKIYDRDQHVRSLYNSCENDSVFYRCKWNEVARIDSINFSEITQIMKSKRFNARNLIYETRYSLGLILTHSLTNNYSDPDTIIKVLKTLVLEGVLDPLFYANSIDRYYMAKFNANYYCNFFDDDLPIFDISTIDRRRNEIFLYPLYFKFKWNNKLNMLPKNYIYDFNSIKQ